MISGDHRQVVFIIHTGPVSVEDLKRNFKEIAPSVLVYNIIDDSLLPEIVRNGGVTERVRQRICSYVVDAENAGADLIFNQCSSAGEVAEMAATLVTVPVIRVDQRMAESACTMGRRIGVVATLPTTMGPTCRLIQRTADAMNKEIEIEECLAEGAFDLLMSGDRAGHNRMVIDSIKGLAEKVDVIVCAQGSMTALLDDLAAANIVTPILTSPRLGVEHAVEVLNQTRGPAPAG